MNQTSKTVQTMCPMNCHPTLCGMKATVDADQTVTIVGDKDNPDSRGFLCVRGRASREIIGNPDRILHPMIRDDRNTDQWRQISWSDAMDRICDKLGALKNEQFGIWQGHGDAATNYGTRIGGLLARRFAHLYGCQWWHPSMICWGLGGFGLGITGLLEVNTKEDMSANAELIVMWGANLDSQPNTAPHLKAAKKRGVKVIAIDVRETAATAQADETLIIAPGTDAALALAMINHIVQSQLHDASFIEQHTVGFAQLQEHISQYTVSWAASITGLTTDQITSLAEQYARIKPAMIVLGGSSMHKSSNGWMGARTIACLPAVTGNAGQPGGGLGPRHGSPSHGQGLNDLLPPDSNRCGKPIPNQMSAITDAICDGTVKALLLSGTNMISSFADTVRLREGMAKTELIVCQDLFFNDTIRECADIVLPATAWLEQLGAKMTHTHLYLMDKACEPAGEAHTLSALLQDLADRLQLDDYFPWPDDEGMIDAVINHPATGYASVAKLRNNHGRCALEISHHGHPDHRYATPSGKLEFFSSRAERMGLPAMPEYLPVPPQRSYPLQMRQGRTLTHFHSFYDNGRALPTLARLNGQPQLWMAIEDANDRAIEQASTVRIYNQRGEFNATVQVTDKIKSGCVWIQDGWQGINRLTDGSAVLPEPALNLFPFSVGQASYDALVEVCKLES
jgi:anaerobic selenocysteine-containing dehydrogenase